MNCYPFIEAEKARQRNVKRACKLLKVSRSAYYAARREQPSDRARQDAEPGRHSRPQADLTCEDSHAVVARRRAWSSTPTAAAQYTSAAYAELAEDSQVTLSVGRTSQCWGNALAESFFSSLKGELIDTRTWPTRAGARRAVVEHLAINPFRQSGNLRSLLALLLRIDRPRHSRPASG